MSAATRMPVRSNLQLLLAQLNVERAKRGETTLSLRKLAEVTGVAPSVLTTLAAGKSQRIDYGTIHRVLQFINQYITVNTNDLIPWTPDQKETGDDR